jgi:hypothetical protein
MMWPIRQIAAEKRRLETLRYLADVPGYEANTHLITAHLRVIGVPTNGDEMAAAASWLDQLGLASLRHVSSQQPPVLRITSEGVEVARGFQMIPGVMQPDP